MMKLILENVRSFAGKHTLLLSPLTLLVGENSSGKTTCLAILSAIFSASGFPSRPGFNEPPFDLGGYDTIATYKGGRGGRAKQFSCGYIVEAEGQSKPTEVLATYKNFLGQPMLTNFSVKRNRASLTLALESSSVTGRLVLPQDDKNPNAIDLTFESPIVEGRLLTLYSLGIVVYEMLKDKKPSRHAMPAFFELLENLPRFQTIAVAPVRTKPRRTYDPISDEFRPEGDHIPLILARALSLTGSGKQRDQLKDALLAFGDASGLFTEVKVRNLGKSSDPFQILVAVAGRPFNLADVGYGVSQSLPVVVESTLGGETRLLLLQQPEVHLHPRAQAAMGSFFAHLVTTQSRRLVIETHSDHLIDRIRQEVAKGTIEPSLVTLIFFERRHGETEIYHMPLDRQGNITNAPPSYRAFFLDEEDSLLRRAHLRD